MQQGKRCADLHSNNSETASFEKQWLLDEAVPLRCAQQIHQIEGFQASKLLVKWEC